MFKSLIAHPPVCARHLCNICRFIWTLPTCLAHWLAGQPLLHLYIVRFYKEPSYQVLTRLSHHVNWSVTQSVNKLLHLPLILFILASWYFLSLSINNTSKAELVNPPSCSLLWHHVNHVQLYHLACWLRHRMATMSLAVSPSQKLPLYSGSCFFDIYHSQGLPSSCIGISSDLYFDGNQGICICGYQNWTQWKVHLPDIPWTQHLHQPLENTKHHILINHSA